MTEKELGEKNVVGDSATTHGRQVIIAILKTNSNALLEGNYKAEKTQLTNSWFPVKKKTKKNTIHKAFNLQKKP